MTRRLQRFSTPFVAQTPNRYQPYAAPYCEKNLVRKGVRLFRSRARIFDTATMKMQGTNLTSLKKNPAVRHDKQTHNLLCTRYIIFFLFLFSFQLFPLYLCIAAGGAGALFYTLRLALRNPDVSWINKKEAEPWNYYKDKHYKVTRVIILICLDCSNYDLKLLRTKLLCILMFIFLFLYSFTLRTRKLKTLKVQHLNIEMQHVN